MGAPIRASSRRGHVETRGFLSFDEVYREAVERFYGGWAWIAFELSCDEPYEYVGRRARAALSSTPVRL